MSAIRIAPPPHRPLPLARRALVMLCLSSAVLAQGTAGLPSTPAQVASASLQPYLDWRAAHFVDWMADGSLLISTRFGDTSQIHRVTAPLGMRAQLSFAPAGVLEAAARPTDADTFVYLEQQPTGATRLYLQHLREHTQQALTDGQYQESELAWSPDGMQLAFVSNRRSPEAQDIYLLDPRLAGAAPRLIAAAVPGMRWHIEGWSVDDRHLLLSRVPAAAAARTEGQLQIADITSGEVVPVPQTGARAAALQAAAARFAADGHGLLVLTHAMANPGADRSADRSADRFLHLAQIDPTTGRSQLLSAALMQDVDQFAQSPDGRYIAYTLADGNGISHLRLIDQQRRLEIPIVSVPAGVISSLSFDASGRRLALTVESTRAPADVYVLEPASGALTRWTQSETGPTDVRSFVEPRTLTFPTWDRPTGESRELPALVYEAAASGAALNGPRPVVIWLCSGEGNECRPRFAPLIQYLVRELGYVVIAPNVRGSSGLGADLAAAGAGPLRVDAVRDVGSLLVWISLQPGLDRAHVALLGEGFGAYLALQSLASYGDRLQGAVAAFPPPLDQLVNVPAIRSPVLLVQGLGESAAPAYEAAQLREGLRSQGVTVQYLGAEQAGQFERRSGRMAYHSAAVSFLAHLLG